MDNTALEHAYKEFLDVATAQPFAPPVTGWDADHVLAHVAAVDTAIAATMLAVRSGQRTAYDNRVSLDPVNLNRLIAQAGGLGELVELVRAQGQLVCAIAARAHDDEMDVQIPVFIVSNDELVVDRVVPVRSLVDGLASTHLPRHGQQLRELYRAGSLT